MLYSLYVFNRRGVCLFNKEWNGLKREDEGGEFKRLIFGMLYSVNEMVDKMAPRKSGDGLLAIKTDSYTLHSYETLTGYRFILVTDNAAGDLRQNLHHIYAQLWVECVVKSPIQDLSTGKKVGSPLFEHQLDAYVEHLSCLGRGGAAVATTKRSAGANSTATTKRPRVEEEDAKHASAALDERVRVVAPPSDYVRVVAGPPGAGDYVLCVLQLALRVECNPPLLAAARAARDAGCRLTVAVALRCRTARHGAFELESLRDVAAGLAGAADACVAVLGEGAERLAALAAGARAVFCDDCPLEPYRSVVAALADCGRRVSAVDAACVVPFRAPEATRACARVRVPLRDGRAAQARPDGPGFEALDRELLAACACAYDDVTKALLADAGAVDRAWRRRDVRPRRVARDVHGRRVDVREAPLGVLQAAGAGLLRQAAQRRDVRERRVAAERHVHYGCIPVFLMARDAQAARADKFLDELLVFREMGYAFCGKHEAAIAADAYSTLPAWARTQLADHAADARRVVGPERLERGESGDVMWDAMQRCLIRHGELHNNLRMTWGKAFLRWAPTPRAAFDLAMRLNDAYALDGLDPNSYAGVAWCFGGFDGPKKPKTTPITGSLRARPTSTHARIRDRYVALVDGAYPAPTI
ncbi:FAD binding domain of DNA photolyase [Aureococcus anophagefferens]|nr:FAD binding domain of DNA photolyase [Aureococcus anophagefferens]